VIPEALHRAAVAFPRSPSPVPADRYHLGRALANIELYAPSLEVNGVQELDGMQWLDDVTIPGEVTPGS
jgi:hypothetical protein